MDRIVEPLFTRRGPNKISSSPLLVDANDDGWPEIFVGGPVIQGLASDGTRLPGWPKRGGRPFASSPAFGDIAGDHRGRVVVGCDDGRVYAFHADGERSRGWPVATGNDVFSTPALVDQDLDGSAEVVVGSDDGFVYIVRGDGSVSSAVEIPNRPFVSASPTVLGGDSSRPPGIAVGAWDGGLYLTAGRERGGLLRLVSADHVIWSSATSFDVQGAGQCLAFAADSVYLVSDRGAAMPGWPRRTESWMASSPTIAELEPGAGLRILVGADRLYVWDLLGHLQPGWPRESGEFVWASPLAFDIDGDGVREIVSAGWDGRIYAFKPNGVLLAGFPLWAGGAMFATPGVAPLPSGGGLLVSAAWDGSIRGWRLPEARFSRGDWLQFRGDPSRTGKAVGAFARSPGDPAPLDVSFPAAKVDGAKASSWRAGRGLPRIEIEGSNLAHARRCMVEYRVSGKHPDHLAPVVNANGRSVAIIQALRRPHRIRYHVSYLDDAGNSARWPESEDAWFISIPIWAHRRPRNAPLVRSSEPQDAGVPSTESSAQPNNP